MALRGNIIGMLAMTMAVAVGGYTVSLKASAERSAVERLRVKIAEERAEIRSLQAELRVRMRMPQLQRWNDEVLALQPIASRQFVGDPVRLASFGRAPAPHGAGEAQVQLAVAQAPAAPAAPAPAPVVTAAVEAPMPTPRPSAPIVSAVDKPVSVPRPRLVLTAVEVASPEAEVAKPAPKAKPAAPAKAAAPARGLDASLIAAVESAARAEVGKVAGGAALR